MAVSRRTLRRIAAALMLSSSLTFASVALTGRAAAANELETFFSSAYTYCDAKLVASLWSIPIDEAKATIGRKILNGIGDAVPVILQEARLAYACEWADTPHTYSDAEKLAALWGLPDPYDAKLKVAKLYTQGRSAEVVAALGQAMPALSQPAGAGSRRLHRLRRLALHLLRRQAGRRAVEHLDRAGEGRDRPEDHQRLWRKRPRPFGRRARVERLRLGRHRPQL